MRALAIAALLAACGPAGGEVAPSCGRTGAELACSNLRAEVDRVA